MNYEIIALPEFSRALKKLSKKYLSLKREYAVLLDELAENPKMGEPLGRGAFKIRLGIASKNKGKSGGGRVITYVQVDEKTIVLLSIYNKGDKDAITDAEIDELIQRFLEKYR